MSEYLLLAIASAGVMGYLISRRYTEQAVYRRRRRREKAEYEAVMDKRQAAEEADRNP